MADTSQVDLRRCIISPDDFVADTEAFVDVRLPRSHGKASYSFIGPGVSQNGAQSVNLTTPHGFNVGAATVPSGKINNPHLHYTAEVFVCTAGTWRFQIGQHGEQTLDISEGTIFSAPTFVFRGFENTGDDDGWLFAVLGGDDTGGIVWAPQILEEAAETGLFLDARNGVIEGPPGQAPTDTIRPLTSEEIFVEQYSDAELSDRVVRADQLLWSDRALLSSVLDCHRTRLAPVIGHGMTENRRQRAPILEPHGFSIEWLEIGVGSRTGRHRSDDSQCLLLIDGDCEIDMRVDVDNHLVERPEVGSVISVPRGAWRDFANVGHSPVRAVVVNESDSPTRLHWDEMIVREAASAGFGLDASGFIAPVSMLGSRR